MTDEPDLEARAETLEHFCTVTGLEPIARFTQRGLDRSVARFAVEFADGETVILGSIDVLWSQAEMTKTMLVAKGTALARVKPIDWQRLIAAIFADCIDVDAAYGESFADNVADWITRYAQTATSAIDGDRDAAASRGLPFIEQNRLHVYAADLAKYIRREYSEQVKMNDLRLALSDLHYERVNVHYTARATGRRSTVSYYAGGTDVDLPELIDDGRDNVTAIRAIQP